MARSARCVCAHRHPLPAGRRLPGRRSARPSARRLHPTRCHSSRRQHIAGVHRHPRRRVHLWVQGAQPQFQHASRRSRVRRVLAELQTGSADRSRRPIARHPGGAVLDRRAYHTVPRQSGQHLHHRRFGRCMPESAHLAHRAQRRCRPRIRHRTGVGNPPARSFAHLGSL